MMLLVQTYLSFTRIGIINGMNRELPYYLGKGNKAKAVELAETTLSYSLYQIIFVTVLFIISYNFLPSNYEIKISVITLYIFISQNIYYTYLLATFRAKTEFIKLSKIQILNAILSIVTLLIVYKFNYLGYCVRIILINSVLTLTVHFIRPLKIKPKLTVSSFKYLLKTGVPIFTGSYLFRISFGIPKLILAYVGSIRLVGLYSPALTLLSGMSVFTDSISTYLFPKMAFQLGANADKKILFKNSLYSHVGILIASIPIILLGWFLIPQLVPQILPKYIESIDVLKIALIISAFYSFKIGFTTLVTLKSWKYLIIYIVTFAALQTLLPIIFLYFLPPLKAVIWGQLITTINMFFISLVTNYLSVKK